MSIRTAVFLLSFTTLFRRSLKIILSVSTALLVLPTLTAFGQSEVIKTVHEASESVGSLPSQALLALTTIAAVGGLVWERKATNVALAQLATDVAVIRETLHGAGLRFEIK